MSTAPQFSSATTAEEAGTALADSISGKNVLLTGTSLNGIGFEAARIIAKYANLLVVTGYNDQRLKLSEDAIKREIPSANIRRLTLDLSSLAAVRRAAAEVNAYPEPIHVLIHNAAAAIGPFKLTVDGLENQIATDHVGPFLFTKLLTPKLLASTSSGYVPRVVFVASAVHPYGPGVDLATLKTPDANKYTAPNAYIEAKAANVLTASELARRAKGALHAFSLHPGIIMTNMNETDGATQLLRQLGVVDAEGKRNEAFPWKTIEQGAATTVVAAFDPRIASSPGAYLDDLVVANEKISAYCADETNAANLWALTEEIIGEKYEF
ncbi:Short-chain dehydrogenase/reductase family protein [Mycena chlorophos]|uniref:Short-chain dehydrogenase/reductase family protein n=1 Tax=Mycena chlorophos TaxID=658473 RepID=A0A8H6SC37_MYCCL|nr:Short-chain dehydrogenase/reductase family protein [Mycena chlorophos]